jgi:glyoxylase-like metal-dependent hydrolase (beta-lactamase superfamily II)
VSVSPIDLLHQGAERIIGSYLLETESGPALFDCGPTTCLEGLRRGLGARGLELGDVHHLLLSHIHLDHAGAAGVIVREQPHIQVHVSRIGAPHLVDPARLETSARRLYGEAFDVLWGELAPVPAENLRIAGERVLGLECFPTPGHATHHVCYLDANGTLFAGDAAGVRIEPDPAVLPPTPPPEFDLHAWEATLDEIEQRSPRQLALVHFGVAKDVERHVAELRSRLRTWAAWVDDGLSEEDFGDAVRGSLHEQGDVDVDAYERAMPFWQSYAGLKRAAEKQQRTA